MLILVFRGMLRDFLAVYGRVSKEQELFGYQGEDLKGDSILVVPTTPLQIVCFSLLLGECVRGGGFDG